MKQITLIGEFLDQSLKKMFLILGLAFVLISPGILNAGPNVLDEKDPVMDLKASLATSTSVVMDMERQRKITGTVTDANTGEVLPDQLL